MMLRKRSDQSCPRRVNIFVPGIALVKLRAVAVEFDFMDPIRTARRARRERSKSRLDEGRKGADANAGQLARDVDGFIGSAILPARTRYGALGHQDAAMSFGKIVGAP